MKQLATDVADIITSYKAELERERAKCADLDKLINHNDFGRMFQCPHCGHGVCEECATECERCTKPICATCTDTQEAEGDDWRGCESE